MGKITFILGGSRSGKSSYALQMAQAAKKRKVAFIATCQPLDAEMRQRIIRHKRSRPLAWETYEEPLHLARVIEQISAQYQLLIIDCLTLWVSNRILRKAADTAVYNEMDRVVARLKKSKANALIVANEVGLGIVPRSALARRFRDLAGSLNQRVAAQADEVFFMVAGIPRRIK